MGKRLDRAILILWALTTVSMFAAIYTVFIHAPEEKIMGAAQRIFYFHVPAALMTYAGVFALLGGSIAYLWTRSRAWDDFSRSSTEIALLFCTIVLLTGPIWAKPAWGVWWTWEARLTTTLILWLLLVACLMVRNYAQDRDLGARLAAIVGIVAAIDVPIIHKAVEWWRGQHPVVFAPGKRDGLAPGMGSALGVSMLAFVLLFLLLLAIRFRVRNLESRLEEATEQLGTD